MNEFSSEWPASRHRIASVFASWERIAEDFHSENAHRQIFASHRIAISVFSTHHIAARICVKRWRSFATHQISSTTMATRIFAKDISRKAFQQLPEFGAYRGLARVLKSPSNPKTCRRKEKILEKGHFYFLCQTLVCTKPWFKRDLNFS